MFALPEQQRLFGQALLTDDEAALRALESEIAPGAGALTARDRVAVYRNNVLASLTDALREAFPVVLRLVGEPFFAFAAREFIAVHPPLRPSLSEYGEAFPAFLQKFPPCRDLVYLADTAQLDWLLNVARYAADLRPISASSLSATAMDDAARLVFQFHPACGYLASAWPLDRIWRANQTESQDETVELGAGGVRLEVSRQHDGIVFRTLDEVEFGFRKSLAGGAPLGFALEQALGVRPDFPAPDALAALFGSGLVVAVARSSSAKERAP
jgi:hypothetical protein